MRIPEYLEADEVNAIIKAAPNREAKLLMLKQWRAVLRESEVLDLEVHDLSLDTLRPTIRVRSGHDDFGEGVYENTLGGWSHFRSGVASANPTSQFPHP